MVSSKGEDQVKFLCHLGIRVELRSDAGLLLQNLHHHRVDAAHSAVQRGGRLSQSRQATIGLGLGGSVTRPHPDQIGAESTCGDADDGDDDEGR